MIELTRLNGGSLFLNCEVIKWVESAPDTVLTLMDGEKIVVREPCGDVVERVFAYRTRLAHASAELGRHAAAAE